MPQGAKAQPYGMASDEQGRIWLVATGVRPNVFMGFDPATEQFFRRNRRSVGWRFGQAHALSRAVGGRLVRNRHELCRPGDCRNSRNRQVTTGKVNAALEAFRKR